ncbi:MAG: tetratricopeptide repeat protein [Cytophagales bacterium]|nr:tetratricopeptide repeat protein [Cytophagales bacterium]
MKFLVSSLFLLICLLSAFGSSKDQIQSLHNQAYALLDSLPDQAMELAQKAETLANAKNLYFEEANSLYIQAHLHREKNEFGKAFITNLKALELLRPLDEQEAISTYISIALNTGEILKQHYAYPEAIQYYDEGIDLALTHNIHKSTLKLLYNKVTALRHNKNYEYALEIINECIEIARADSNEYVLISALNQKGLIHKDQGNFKQARFTYDQIITHEFQTERSAKYIGRAWHNIGVTHLAQENYTLAIHAYQKAAESFEQVPGTQDQFTTWLDMALTYHKMKDFDSAQHVATQALASYPDQSLLPDNFVLYNVLSKICHDLNQPDNSHNYSQLYVKENERFLTQQKALLEVKDHYKMEVLTAGFFAQLQSEEDQVLLRRYLIASILVTLLFYFVKLVKRKQLQKMLSREFEKLTFLIF